MPYIMDRFSGRAFFSFCKNPEQPRAKIHRLGNRRRGSGHRVGDAPLTISICSLLLTREPPGTHCHGPGAPSTGTMDKPFTPSSGIKATNCFLFSRRDSSGCSRIHLYPCPAALDGKIRSLRRRGAVDQRPSRARHALPDGKRVRNPMGGRKLSHTGAFSCRTFCSWQCAAGHGTTA